MEAEQKKIYNKLKRATKSNILNKVAQQGVARS